MDVFKKLTTARRRTRSNSVVSDADRDEGDFCYYQHDNDRDNDMVEGIFGDVGASNDNGGSSSSLYGRRRDSGSTADARPPPMAVVTSTKFDSDESFSMVARAMICRYQNVNMSEREAIHDTLGKADDLRAFIEALDLRFTVLTTESTDGKDDIGGNDAFSEIILRTRSIFDATLKAMWREKESPSLTLGMMGQEKIYREQRDEIVDDHSESRRQHPKTPKNLRMSPMRTSSFNYNNHGVISQSESNDSGCSEGSNNSMFQPFKRPRRWFFPQKKNERFVTQPFSSSAMKSILMNNPFPIKTTLPKLHFDFGGSSSSSNSNDTSKTTMIFGDIGRGHKPVQSLQLDGTSSYTSLGDDGKGGATGSSSLSYMPPTSPIRKVSIEFLLDNQSVIDPMQNGHSLTDDRSIDRVGC